jgi:hypothetical protein
VTSKLVAPRYEPASAYHPPTPAPFELSVETLSVEELLSAPATRAILQEHAPAVLQLAAIPQFKTVQSTLTLREAGVLLPLDMSVVVPAVDAALRALPNSEWPASVR